MPELTAKVCIDCGQDCSNRPRVKDARGRYLCKACEAARARAASPHQAQSQPQPPADEGVFDLMPDSLLGDVPAPCPACSQPIPSGSVLCLKCGFDVRKGAQHAIGTGIDDPDDPPAPKGKPAAANCPKCGYNLKGLKTPKCPECGTLVLPKSKRQLLQEDSQRSARMEYIRPLIMLAAGLAGLIVFHLARSETEALVGTLIVFAIKVPSGTLAFWLLCLAWLGFDAPLRLTVLRLAGIYAVTDFADRVLSLTGLPILAWPVSFFLYYGLLMQELDLDEWRDALVLSLLMKGIAVAATFGVLYAAGAL